MYPIPGHLAFAASSARFFKVSIPVAVIASFVPDVIDKGLNDLLQITPYGRYFMHSIPSVVVCSVLVGWLWGKESGWGWFAGHATHLAGDLGSFLPLWMPFVQYDWPPDKNITLYAITNPFRHLFSPEMLSELMMGIWTLALFRFARNADRFSRVQQLICYTGIWAYGLLRVWLG